MNFRRNAAPRRRAKQPGTCLGIAAICTIVSWVSAGPALASPEQDPAVVGDASAIEAGVEVRGGADAPFVLLEAVEPVAVGDGVRTDTTGFAEIAYFDGSRTRLDIDTEFEVVELVNDAGTALTRTSMGVGRTWHRVESLGEGEFTVETSQATATVRGTAFVLACAAGDSCTYLVFEGIVDLTLADGSVVEVIGPAEVEIVGGVAGPLTPVTLDRLLADPWLLDNANRDIAAGFGDLVAILGTTEVTTTAALSTTSTSTTTADTSTTTADTSTTTADTSTTTADTSTTTTEPSTSTSEASPSSTTTEPSSSTTTERPNEPSTSTTTTTTQTPTEPTTSTTTTTTTTEAPTSTSTTTTSTTTSTSTTTTSTTTTSTTTTSTTTTTTTTTTQPSTTTTTPPSRVGICHRVGDGIYEYRVIDRHAYRGHIGHGDIRALWGRWCPGGESAVASASVQASMATTTTTVAPG